MCILLCNDFVYFEMGAGRGSPVNFFKEFYGYALLCSRLEQINKEMILGIERLADIPHAVCLLWDFQSEHTASKNKTQHESGLFNVLQIEPNQLMVTRRKLFSEVVKGAK